MKEIYHYAYEGDCGEIDAFFDEKLKLIEYWFCNDAHYRNEYMNPLLEKLGIKVWDLPSGKWNKADKIIKKAVD